MPINEHKRRPNNEELTGNEWLNPEKYLRFLAPDLYIQYNADLKSSDDNPGFYDEIKRIQRFSHNMIRYSINPDDSSAINPYNGQQLINPKTHHPFTIEDAGIDRNLCQGSTIGIEGRERMVAELTISLYRK